MKKLLYIIGIPLSMVCCQSENTQELKQFEGEQTCIIARVIDGKYSGVASTHHKNESGTIDGYISYKEDGQENHYRCFYNSQYTYREMVHLVREEFQEKYPINTILFAPQVKRYPTQTESYF